MAQNAFLSITGQKTGQIKGGVIQKGREGQIAVFAAYHEIISPRDPTSGLATGKRMHKPIIITKEIDKSSPVLYQLLCTNENLTDVTLRFWAPNMATSIGTGQEVQNYTIKLINAHIASITLNMADNKIPGQTSLPEEERVEFTYQKITWTWTDGGVTFSDDWLSPV